MSTTEVVINGRLYLVTAECSPTATETVDKKLERLICRHTSDAESYQPEPEKTLAMCEIVREYATDTKVKEQ